MHLQFGIIDQELGNPVSGGCPACANNVKRWLCQYVCSPDQDLFTRDLQLQQVPSPLNPSETVQALTGTLLVDRAWACASFAACNGTGTVKMNAAMSSCAGFYNFLLGPAAALAGTDFTMNYTDNVPEAMQVPVDTCCNHMNNWLDPSAGNSSCDCGSCQQMCPGAGGCPGRHNRSSNPFAGIGDYTLGALYGLDWAVVGITYAAIVVVIVGKLAVDSFLDRSDGAGKHTSDLRGGEAGSQRWEPNEEQSRPGAGEALWRGPAGEPAYRQLDR